jgi:transcriptional regulator with XRE-family HTH domain
MPVTLSKPAKRAARVPAREVARELRQTRDLLEAALQRVNAALAGSSAMTRPPKPLRPAAIAAAPRDPTLSLGALRAALGWSRALLASALNCSERALASWEQGEPVSAVYAARGRELQSLYHQLATLMKPEEVGAWLNTEMEEFEGRRPVDLVRQGETGRLWDCIYFLRSGQPD